jgi:hypothetical protein
MKKTFAFAILIIPSVLVASFTHTNENIANSEIVGVWVTGNPTIPSTFHMKVFEKNGDYYNVGFEKEKTIMSHKGTYKVLDESKYSEHVTELRVNAAWDLKGKEFINNYKFSNDKKELVLSGVVFSKDGRDSLKWSHKYTRVEIP